MKTATHFNLTLLSKHRSFVMGIAILWVMWFHTDITSSIPFITFFREIGYGGVDLFILLSGIGAFFSLQKNSSSASFMKRRALRIMPSYYPFIILWLIMIKITGELYGTEIIGNLTMAGWWCNLRNQFNWYTNAIWFFYLLAPVIVEIILSVPNNKKRLINLCLLLCASFLFSMTFWHKQLLIAFARMPLFILGIGIGYFIKNSLNNQKQNSVWNRTIILFVNLTMIIGFLLLYIFKTKFSGDMWLYGLWWYPFILIAPGLALDLSFAAEILEKNFLSNFICKGIRQLGNSSFELFLIHIAVFEFLKSRYTLSAFHWIITIIMVSICSLLYRKLILLLSSRLTTHIS